MSLEGSFSKLTINDSTAPATALKALVFKSKTKSGAKPIVVVGLQETKTPANIIASATESKEPRLAKNEYFAQYFKIDDATKFNLSHLENSESEFFVVLDSSISALSEETIFATNDNSIKFTKKSLDQYINSLSKADVKIIDFSKVPEASPITKTKKAPAATPAKKDSSSVDSKLIGVTVKKADDFSAWYQQILTKGEMLDFYDVSGCYILRPASYAIWEQIQRWFDAKIKKLGVQNTYFPMFVSSKVLEREKDHIEGFAPEVAWVTKAGKSDLEEPIAIRPTSETVMYPYFAKWVQSHRDLPLKLNQWNNVVRWEFKHPQPFIRTREFLWQEGHTVFPNAEDAQEEVLQILDFYADVYKELLAVPVVKGKKTEKEKFAGAVFTTTCEGYIPQTGRGIQGATSHYLGQNFSKMFNLSVESPLGKDHPKLFAYQNSWGLSTRSIGVMVMIHSDDKGLVVPPRVSQFQTVIVPVGLTNKTSVEEKNKILDTAAIIDRRLKAEDIRSTADFRENYTPGWKFANWELKGVPLRIEVGPRDVKENQVTVVRRNDGKKTTVSLDKLEEEIPKLLEEMHWDLYNAAKEKFDSHRVIVDEWKDFVPALNGNNVVLSPWCGVEECEEEIKTASAKKNDGENFEEDDKAPSMGAKSLCIPFEQPELKEGATCVKCGEKAVNYTMFGRSY
ncbi:hypothetical protein ACO0SA_002873 [Hanseniaspora valbyensis]